MTMFRELDMRLRPGWGEAEMKATELT